MEEKIVTIGKLLEEGLIKKTTRVRISIKDLKCLGLLKPLSREKIKRITARKLIKRGLIKR
jgi:hypothetical protein